MMDTIKKIANAILDAGEGCQSGLVYVDPVEAAKAAIAALETDAEPVAWQAQGDDGIWRYVEMPRTAKSMGMPVRPVYAAPPAPSVAVKALEWEEGDGVNCSVSYRTANTDVGLRYWQIECEWGIVGDIGSGELRLTDNDAKAAAQADYETRIRSALSAQVQDVGGATSRKACTGERRYGCVGSRGIPQEDRS